jgi:hypothetical protein
MAVERLRPPVATTGRIDELGGDAKALSRALDAPGDDHGRGQRAPGLGVLPFGHEVGGIPGDHPEGGDLRQAVDDLLPHALADVLEACVGTVIAEGHDGDGVPAGRGRADEASGRPAAFPPLEHGEVSTLGKVDDRLVGLTLRAVVARHARAEAPRLNPDDRIRARVEGRLLAEDLHADHVFLELVAAAGDGLRDDEAEEALEAVDLLEGRAGQHPVQLLPDRAGAVLGRRPGGAGGRPVPIGRGHRPSIAPNVLSICRRTARGAARPRF